MHSFSILQMCEKTEIEGTEGKENANTFIFKGNIENC